MSFLRLSLKAFIRTVHGWSEATRGRLQRRDHITLPWRRLNLSFDFCISGRMCRIWFDFLFIGTQISFCSADRAFTTFTIVQRFFYIKASAAVCGQLSSERNLIYWNFTLKFRSVLIIIIQNLIFLFWVEVMNRRLFSTHFNNANPGGGPSRAASLSVLGSQLTGPRSRGVQGTRSCTSTPL